MSSLSFKKYKKIKLKTNSMTDFVNYLKNTILKLEYYSNVLYI